MPDKPGCLIICGQSPSIAGAAGNRIALDRIAALASEYEVDLVLIVNRKDPVSSNLARELGVRRLTVFRVGRLSKVISVLRNLPSVPPRYSTRQSRAAVRFLADALATNQYALVRYEFSQVAPYQAALRHSARAVLAVHDVQLQVVLRAPFFERLLFSAPTYRYEERLLRSFDQITVLSGKDKHLIDGLYPYCNVEVERPSLSPFVHKVRREPDNIDPASLLFWGAMNRPENEDAVLFFVRQCLPELKARFPHIILYVVGNAPSERILKLKGDSVVVTGFVEDPSSYFERAALGIVPLLRGAGVKLKTLELLEAGLEVISTYVGAEGVDDTQGSLKVVDRSTFTQAVTSALERQARARSATQ